MRTTDQYGQTLCDRIEELEQWQKEAIELLGVAKPTYQYCKEFKQWSKKKHELIEKAEPPCQ